ncbi:MAG: hypothetical protein H7A21_05845 [Spirochaetales bacterium]|nr:hypothetical protein [Leptospiraceae bacterium]MCP5480932.1 hypothetical protein [Spirochaetales bacterium]MCP5485312.1 hypothetical protein [Spirochaetales bacterium]
MKQPEAWPVLVVEPDRARLISGVSSFLFEGPLGPSPRERTQLLEDAELALARNDRESLPLLAWQAPAGTGSEFLKVVETHAVRAGGLRVAGSYHENLPFEALGKGATYWIDHFSVLRLPEEGAPRSTAVPPSMPRILIVGNSASESPAGELTHVRTEAQEIAEAFLSIEEKSLPEAQVRLLLRTPGEHEFTQLMAEHDICFYLGHGRRIGGFPAVLLQEGWCPLISEAGGHTSENRLVVFGACLEGEGRLRFPGSGAAVYPIARLADRASVMLPTLARALAAGDPIWKAFARACAEDRQSGDIRRLLFRLQGAADLQPIRTED